MRFQNVMHGAAASVAVVLTINIITAAGLRAADNKSQTLVYAVYNGEDTATEVFKTMSSAQAATGERIEAYAVVSKDLKGKVRVRDQRRTDAGVGAVVGGVIGLLGGPVGVAIGASTGGAVGYLTGEAVGIPREKVESMKQSLVPDSSALVVVLDDKWVKDVERDLTQAHARAVVANQIASK
jgi:uncharacterized membrane protein